MMTHKKTTLASSLLALILFQAPSAHASTVYLTLDQYDYITNLAEIELDYRPVGMVLGGSINLTKDTYLQYQLGSWSQDSASVPSDNQASSGFESELVSIGLRKMIGNWELHASYTGMNDEMDVRDQQNGRVSATSDADAMSLKLNVGYQIETGAWSRFATFGLQYDDTEIRALFDQTDQIIKQQSDSFYGTLKLGTDYYQSNGDASGWLLGGSASWYQEVSSGSSVDQQRSDQGPAGAPVGGGRRNVNRTKGDSFGIISLYMSYMFNDHWSIEISPSFGFAGEENSNSAALTLAHNF